MNIFTLQDTAEIFARDGVMFGARQRCALEPVQSTAAYGGLGMTDAQINYLFEVILEQTCESLFAACYAKPCVLLFEAEAMLTFYANRISAENETKWRVQSDEAWADVANARAAA